MVIRERGSVTIYAVLMMSVLACLAWIVMIVGTISTQVAAAQTAADFAALAALQSESGCDAAHAVASRNGATLRDCTLNEGDAIVTVATSIQVADAMTWLGVPREFIVKAHAAR